MNTVSVLLLMFFTFCGWFVGQLVNYLADVLPEKRRLVKISCATCKSEHPGYKYWVFNLACKACGSYPGWRHLWMAVVFALFGMRLALDEGTVINDFFDMLVLAYFGLVIVIDLEYRLVMHPVSIVGAGIGLLVGVGWRGLLPTLAGGLAGFAVMFGLYMIGYFYGRWSARRRNLEIFEEGLGFGDVILGGIMGLFLGWPGVLAGLLLAIVLAGGVSLVLLAVALLRRNYKPDMSIAYAPYLALAVILLLIQRGVIF